VDERTSHPVGTRASGFKLAARASPKRRFTRHVCVFAKLNLTVREHTSLTVRTATVARELLTELCFILDVRGVEFFHRCIVMASFVLVCPPVLAISENRPPVISAQVCRIAAIKPSNTSKYEIEILEAPPVIIDSGGVENLDGGSVPLRDARDADDDAQTRAPG
jgi:hypothetical protein